MFNGSKLGGEARPPVVAVARNTTEDNMLHIIDSTCHSLSMLSAQSEYDENLSSASYSVSDSSSRLPPATSPLLDHGYDTLVVSTRPTINPYQSEMTSRHWRHRAPLCSNLLKHLPDHLLVKILGYLNSIELSRCAQVCRRLEQLAWTPHLWQHIQLLCGVNVDHAIKTITKRLQIRKNWHLDSVQVSHSHHSFTDKSLFTLAPHCDQLQQLLLHGAIHITNAGVNAITSICHARLQHIDLTGCLQLTTAIMVASPLTHLYAANHHRQLSPTIIQHVDLTDCVEVRDADLTLLLEHCPRLTHLYLRRCVQLTDNSLRQVAVYCPELRELSVSDCVQTSDFTLYELGRLETNLRYLSVAKCRKVSDAGLNVIARKCYKLRYLNVRGCEAISDDSISILARSCVRLCALDIGKCDVSDGGLRQLAESCPNLKKLSLRGCDVISDRGIQCVAYYCRRLQQLNIQDCQVTIDGYRTVKKYCKRCIIEHTNPGFC